MQDKRELLTRAEAQITSATDPSKTYKLEADMKAAQAWAKEQQNYEMVIEAGRLYLLAKRKTTELIAPGIRDPNMGRPNKGNEIVTLSDFGFDKMEWSRRKKLIELTEDFIDDYIDDCINKQIEPTFYGYLGFIKTSEREAISDFEEPDTDWSAELLDKWQVSEGQLWTIGKHRLLCGDATSHQDVQRLMVGEIPSIIINDPPYGMRLNTDFSGMKSKLLDIDVHQGDTYDQVEGDWQDYNANPIREMWAGVKEQFWFGADYYANTLGDTMHNGAWLVWDKRLEESSDKMYGSCFELIWSATRHKRDIFRHKWAGIFGLDTDKRMHPNQKPVTLYSDILYRYSKMQDTMLDCYVGSGTSLIACEYMGRIGRGIELLPAYVAVTLERMSVSYPNLEINHE